MPRQNLQNLVDNAVGNENQDVEKFLKEKENVRKQYDCLIREYFELKEKKDKVSKKLNSLVYEYPEYLNDVIE